MSRENPPTRRKRLPRSLRGKLVRLVVLPVAGIAVLGVAAKPAYASFKRWRMERNLAAAQDAARGLKMDTARDLSLTVLRAGDPRIEAFRVLEESMASLQDPRHAQVSRALLFHPDSSGEDRLKGFRGVASGSPLGVVAQAWTQLPEACRDDDRFMVILADRLISEHRLPDAAALLARKPQPAPAVQLRLIRILLKSGKAEGTDEAQRRLAKLWQDAPALRHELLPVLFEIPAELVRPALLAPVRPVLAEMPENLPAFAVALIDMAANQSGRAALLRTLTERWKDQEPAALAAFFLRLGLNERLLEVFPHSAEVRDAALFRHQLEAAVALRRWPQVLEALDLHERSLPRFEAMAHRAIAAAGTGNYPLQNEAWTGAINEARSSTDDEALLKLHRMARNAGLQAEAERAMVEAIKSRRGPLPLYSDLRPLLESLLAQNREQELTQICSAYLSFEPANPVLMAQYSYMACLNDLATPQTLLKAMKPLAAAFPDTVPIHCVLATIQLCAREDAAAAETFGNLKLGDPAQLPPGYRAAHLTAAVVSGRLSPAGDEAAAFPWKSLLPCERRKFTAIIKAWEAERASAAASGR